MSALKKLQSMHDQAVVARRERLIEVADIGDRITALEDRRRDLQRELLRIEGLLNNFPAILAAIPGVDKTLDTEDGESVASESTSLSGLGPVLVQHLGAEDVTNG